MPYKNPKQSRDYKAERKRGKNKLANVSEDEKNAAADKLMEKAARKAGRPSTYSQDRAAEIIQRIQTGETLQAICRDEHMPSVSGVYWWTYTVPGFAQAIERARAVQGEFWGEKAIDEAMNDPADKIAAMHARTRCDTLLKGAGRRDPERWGDKPSPGAGVQVVINTNLGMDQPLNAGRLVATARDNGASVSRDDDSQPQVIEDKAESE